MTTTHTAADMDASRYSPRATCNGWHDWRDESCARCGIAAPDGADALPLVEQNQLVFRFPDRLSREQRERIGAAMHVRFAELVEDARRLRASEGVQR